ncbi:MAG TPA: aminotransferase class V-fold PLP-dependent enzyme, partial [Gaiellaceae bacterium]
PVAVFDEYQRLQRELEREPTEFLGRRFEESMRAARGALAAFVGARTDDLVFAPNATSALNAVIRSLRIRPEEEILTTKHEYGAILRTLGFIRASVVQVRKIRRRSGAASTTSTVSSSPCTSGRARRSPECPSARTTTTPTSSGSWPRSDTLSRGDPIRDPHVARRARPRT